MSKDLGRDPKLASIYWTFLLSILFACMLKHFSRVQFFVIPMGYSLPGYFVHGILQARILEWVAMPSSRGSSQTRK